MRTRYQRHGKVLFIGFDPDFVLAIAYINSRRIGHVQIISSIKAFIAEARLGPDALNPSFDEASFDAALGNGKQAIKSIPTDQTRIARTGDICADEILFQAKLNQHSCR